MEERRIPGLQLAIMRGATVVKISNYGKANLENSIPVTNESIFPVNSITKAFTGVAIMQLAEAGKLNILDMLSLHLDSLPDSWKKITLIQILSHTSGLPDILTEDGQVMGLGDETLALRKAMILPLVFNAGEKFDYNQTGYVLLGKIISNLSGMHFTKFIEERQFKPAGMLSTRFGDSYDVIQHYAGAYTLTKQVGNRFIKNNSPGISYMQFPLFFRTAAGILSNATDIGNWIVALKGGKLLNKQGIL